MKSSIFTNVVLGGVIGGIASAIFDNDEDNNKTLMGVSIGVLAGLVLYNHKRMQTIELNIKNGIVDDLKDEILKNIKIDELRTSIDVIVKQELSGIISNSEEYAKRNIDNTVKKINNQNILKLSSDVNDRLNLMDSKISKLKYTYNGFGDSKYDLVREAINNGNYTSYEIERIIKSLEKL